MLQVNNLSKSYGDRVLFEKVGFSISSRERIGFVGRNGSGKSTLMKIIMERETSDAGSVLIPKGYKIGYLDQHISFTKANLLEECCTVLPEEEQYDFYKAEKILFGLGFTEEDFDKDPKDFSGGFQLRINLTKVLMQHPDLLLLDEPTNYLDILSLRWLERFLKNFPGEVILITHDREFMDSVVTHVMGITRKQIRKIKGNTRQYYEQILADEEIYEKTRQNQEKKVKQLQDFVDRFGAKASKATQAQSKAKQIKKMSILGALHQEMSLGFRFNYEKTEAKNLLSISNLSFGFDDEILFSDLEFQVDPGDCVAIIGKNGKGKTTLLNVIAGQLKKKSGDIRFHSSCKYGYYQQTNRKDLHPESTIIDEVTSANTSLSFSAVRSICGAMMFPGELAEKKIKVLSGGEQSRVLLGQVLAKSCNLLLLDEPSNHLDMQSIEAITEEISNFPGGTMIVTHNEDMLRALATKLIIFRDGNAELFLGTYDEFLEKIGWSDEEGAKPAKKKSKSKDTKKQKAFLINEKSKKLKPLKKDLEKTEKNIEKLESSLEAANKEVTSLAQNGQSSELKNLYKKISITQSEVDSAYKSMDDLMAKIESLTDKYDTQINEL